MPRARTIKPHFTPAQLLPPRSGEIQETLGREGQRSSDNKALAIAAEIPERFTTPPETLGKNRVNPCRASLFGGFHERFTRRKIFSASRGRRRESVSVGKTLDHRARPVERHVLRCIDVVGIELPHVRQ